MTAGRRGTALITGGTRGIGLGIARALADQRWNLALCGRRPDAEVAAVLDDLRQTGSEIGYHRADLADDDDRARLVGQVRERWGVVHALVNNAGRAPQVRADLLDATAESFDEVLAANLRGPYFLTQAIARDQVERRRADPSFTAAIVFITSVSAVYASANRGEYCVSKAALSMAARLFAARLAADGIPVYEIRPGIVETDMTAPVREAYDARIAQGLVPEGRWGRPEDVGRIVAALVRGDLPYSTGSVIAMDGGLSIPRL
ncbi:MAG TPA: 3-ketoacyl-ACP reductase [Vicinamibacterales bacterium]|nr:3-ketoacyl-ACP reductase [Vicinamibacterales bacterium]